MPLMTVTDDCYSIHVAQVATDMYLKAPIVCWLLQELGQMYILPQCPQLSSSSLDTGTHTTASIGHN